MKLKTNNKEYIQREQQYLLDSIQNWYFDSIENFHNLSDKERLNFVMAELRRCSDYAYNMKRIPNHQERLAEHLKGEPGCIDIPTKYYLMLEVIADLHQVKVDDIPNDYQDKLLNNFHNRMAYALLKLEYKFNK